MGTKAETLFPTGEFQQRGYGDCQTLAGGLNTLLNTPEVRNLETGDVKYPSGKEHLASLITHHGGGRYTVNFPGRDPVNVSPQDLRDPKLASTSDVGVSVLEKAALKVHEREGRVPDPMKLFMGPETKTYNMPLADTPENAMLSESISGKALIHNLESQVQAGDAIMWGAVTEEKTVKDIDGNDVHLPSPHAYTIIPQADGETFVVENPHDSDKPFTFSREQAAANFNHVFVSEAPGRKFDIPLELNGVATAAEGVATNLQRVWDYEGAYSLDGDSARDDVDPKQRAKDEAAQQEALIDLQKSRQDLTAALAETDAKLPDAPTPAPEPVQPEPKPEPKPEPDTEKEDQQKPAPLPDDDNKKPTPPSPQPDGTDEKDKDQRPVPTPEPDQNGQVRPSPGPKPDGAEDKQQGEGAEKGEPRPTPGPGPDGTEGREDDGDEKQQDGQGQDGKGGQQQGDGTTPAPQPDAVDGTGKQPFIQQNTNAAIAALPESVRAQVEQLKTDLSDGKYNDGSAIEGLTGKENLKDDLGLNKDNTNNLLKLTTELAKDGKLDEADKEKIADKAKEMQDQQLNPAAAATGVAPSQVKAQTPEGFEAVQQTGATR